MREEVINREISIFKKERSIGEVKINYGIKKKQMFLSSKREIDQSTTLTLPVDLCSG